MTDKMKKRLLDLKAQQEKGEATRCPRCGVKTMKPELYTNALSRVADIYVCDACGTAEAMLACMNQTYPLTCWAAFQPERPESNFKEMSAVDVLTQVAINQLETLTMLCEKCRREPEHADEYRLEAFERCPGLAELWTEPFHAKYDAKKGAVMVRFEPDENGALQVVAHSWEDETT